MGLYMELDKISRKLKQLNFTEDWIDMRYGAGMYTYDYEDEDRTEFYVRIYSWSEPIKASLESHPNGKEHYVLKEWDYIHWTEFLDFLNNI